MRTKWVTLVAAVVVAVGLAFIASAQQNAGQQNAEIQVLPVQGNVYLVTGAGGNIVVQAGPQGMVVVDTGLAQMSDKALAAITKLSPKKIQYIINTHVHPDHTGGNDAFRQAGTTIAGANVTANLTDVKLGAQIFAQDNVLQRMSAPTGSQSPAPFGAWPTEVTFARGWSVSYDGAPGTMGTRTG